MPLPKEDKKFLKIDYLRFENKSQVLRLQQSAKVSHKENSVTIPSYKLPHRKATGLISDYAELPGLANHVQSGSGHTESGLLPQIGRLNTIDIAER